jgi:hypothetical protein
MGALGQWNRLASNWEAGGRVGFVIANVVDLSAVADKVLVTGSPVTYGATLRATF